MAQSETKNPFKRTHNNAIDLDAEHAQSESHPSCKKAKHDDENSASCETIYGNTNRQKHSQKERNVFRRQQKKQRKQEQFASMTEEEKQEQRNKKMEQRKRKQELKEAQNKKTMEASANGMKICVDLSFNAEHTNINKQLCYCWNTNKCAAHSISFHLVNVNEKWMQYFAEQGVVSWKGIHIHQNKDIVDAFDGVDKQHLIYLTPDSEHVLSESEFREHKHENVYILGGIVDRTIKKNLTFDRARKLGIRHCKLPLDSLPDIQGRRSLNINAVFNMLVRFQNTEESWTDIMQQEVPNRNKRSAQTKKQRRRNRNKDNEDKKCKK